MDEGMAQAPRKLDSKIGPTGNEIFNFNEVLVSQVSQEVESSGEKNDIGNQFTFDMDTNEETDCKDDLSPFSESSIKYQTSSDNDSEKPIEIPHGSISMKYRSELQP